MITKVDCIRGSRWRIDLNPLSQPTGTGIPRCTKRHVGGLVARLTGLSRLQVEGRQTKEKEVTSKIIQG